MASRRKKKVPKVRGSKAAPAVATAATNGSLADVKVRARLYCQGIGDCHLLQFPKADGQSFWMLIDCGIHTSITGGPAKIDAIVASVLSFTKRLDVIVATHEHWDHISGFMTANEKFKQFEIGEIWMAWTEDPRDAQARTLDKYKSLALDALQGASQRLNALKLPGQHLAVVRDGVESILGFNFGAQGERVRSARDTLVSLAKDRVRYLEPRNPPLSLPGVPNLRIFVLGPPRDAKLLGIADRTSEMYGLAGGTGWPIAHALNTALATTGFKDSEAAENSAPFDVNVGVPLSEILQAASRPVAAGPTAGGKESFEAQTASFVRDHYSGPARGPDLTQGASKTAPSQNPSRDQSWRRVDHDWLGVSADLAMQLDSRTNNTSLVLAFEFIDTGRVLLFAADAQVGNWLSWQDVKWKLSEQETVTGPGLLARTVFYKVGHHGSQNATLKEKGLQQMTHADLAAFIPTNELDAKKVKWGQMPFEAILSDLKVRTSGRVIRADDPWIASADAGVAFKTPSGSVRAIDHEPGLFVALDIA